jgi:RimJ/RimL family protein N-acetyltransferase
LIIRQAVEKDAQSFAELIHKVESTTNNMLFEPGERKINPENQQKMIQAFSGEDNSTIFLCETSSHLVGYLIAKGGFAKRNRHSAYLVIGILEEFRGQGIGSKLFEELDTWARKQHIHRLELTVIANNQHALALYQKMGFEIEGTKRHSLKINDEFVDEYYMSKLL